MMSEQHWTLATLNKAYQQGYLNGLAGQSTEDCPYTDDVLIAAWEAGWDDGHCQHRRAAKERSHLRYA